MNKKTYNERISELKDNEVFVFGSNLKGYHGGGAAGFASFGKSNEESFNYHNKPNGWKGLWNIKGVGEGYQEGTIGKSYALPTVYIPGNQLPKEDIIANIKKLYKFANDNPDLIFYIAGSCIGPSPLSGYSHEQFCQMYKEAVNLDINDIPNNIIFSATYMELLLV